MESYKMVKKHKNTNQKKTASQLTIEEGEQFIKAALRVRLGTSAARRTRTMADIAASSLLMHRTRRQVVPEEPNRKSKPIHKQDKLVPSLKVAPARKSQPAKGSLSSSTGKDTKPAVPSAAMPLSTPVARTASKDNKIVKLAKTNSKDAQIPAFGFIDVCFCIDCTGSMSPELGQVQETIKTIISNIQSKVRTQGLQLRFAIVSYRDHPPQDSSYVTQHLDFTDQYEAIEYVKKLSAFGGGDEPEAAHDGLYLAAKKLNWAVVDGTPVLRYIFHIADAPPHGKQFLNTLQAHEGCLCGLKTDEVILEINKKSIHYRLIKSKPNPKLDQMQNIFRRKVGDFDSTDLANAREMNVKVSDMIIHEVLPDYA